MRARVNGRVEAGVEVNVGGWSATPHADVPTLLSDVRARDAYLRAFAARGLEISALNVTGNALNPSTRDHADALVDTIRLAGALGVGMVVTTSGLPATSSLKPLARMPCPTNARQSKLSIALMHTTASCVPVFFRAPSMHPAVPVDVRCIPAPLASLSPSPKPPS